MGTSSNSATANNRARFLLNVDLEVVVDVVSYKFDYGQTTGKSGSLSSRLGSPLEAILVVGTVMYVLRWGAEG